jgi:hypothetical protein
MTTDQLKENIRQEIAKAIQQGLGSQLKASDYEIVIQETENTNNIAKNILLSVNVTITILNTSLIDESGLKEAIKSYVEQHNIACNKTRTQNQTLSTQQKVCPIFIKSHEIKVKQPAKVQTAVNPQKKPTGPVTTTSTTTTTTQKTAPIPADDSSETKKTKGTTLISKISFATQALAEQRDRLIRIRNQINLNLWEKITTWISSFFPKNERLIQDKIGALDGLIAITEKQETLMDFYHMTNCIENPNLAEDNNNESTDSLLVRQYCKTLNQTRVGFFNTESYTNTA